MAAWINLFTFPYVCCSSWKNGGACKPPFFCGEDGREN